MNIVPPFARYWEENEGKHLVRIGARTFQRRILTATTIAKFISIECELANIPELNSKRLKFANKLELDSKSSSYISANCKFEITVKFEIEFGIPNAKKSSESDTSECKNGFRFIIDKLEKEKWKSILTCEVELRGVVGEEECNQQQKTDAGLASMESKEREERGWYRVRRITVQKLVLHCHPQFDRASIP